MARITIFELISSSVSFSSELYRLDKLLHDKNGVRIEIAPRSMMIEAKTKVEYYPFEKFVDNFAFKKWSSRGTCIDCDDMRVALKISDILDNENPSKDEVIIYLEYVANLFMLFSKIELKSDCHYFDTDVLLAAKGNIIKILDWLNCETKTFESEERVIIVEKNATVTSVAEIVSPSLAYLLVEFNHYSLRGDVSAKKAILLTLASELEPRRKELTNANKQLADNVFYMLNNLNLRHNNKSKKDKNYKAFVSKLSVSKLEIWYDDLYRMFLLAFLELDQIERNLRINELKACIETK